MDTVNMDTVNKSYGLCRFLSFTDREEVEGELDVVLTDLYESIEAVRVNACELEEMFDRILMGEQSAV